MPVTLPDPKVKALRPRTCAHFEWDSQAVGLAAMLSADVKTVGARHDPHRPCSHLLATPGGRRSGTHLHGFGSAPPA